MYGISEQGGFKSIGMLRTSNMPKSRVLLYTLSQLNSKLIRTISSNGLVET